VNPYYILGGVLAALGIATAGFFTGVEWQQGQDAIAQNAALKQANATIQRLNDEARAKEQKHGEEVNRIADQLVKEKRDAWKREQDGATELLTLKRRLSIDVEYTCPGTETPTSPDGTTVTVRADIASGTAVALEALASRGDIAIIERNKAVKLAQEYYRTCQPSG